jgi:aryl-alcohol dehydrogenase-like predicted oxidoreductase
LEQKRLAYLSRVAIQQVDITFLTSVKNVVSKSINIFIQHTMHPKMTPIEEIFKALETLNQNDFIDWLLANKQKLIENGKMYLHQRQESSEQNTTEQMA